MKVFEICIPASSGNLGPGYDCLGLALKLYNKAVIVWDTRSGPLSPQELQSWAKSLPFEQASLALAYAFYARDKRVDLPAVEVNFAGDIPIARGLGSSATCALAGLAAAQLVHRATCGREELLALGTALEGHPDNVAPALFGGLVLSKKLGVSVAFTKLACHERIHPLLLVPDFELSTAESRSVLPGTLPHREAVEQIASFGFLIQGLADGRPDLLEQGSKDFLHQPYRRGLIEGYDEIEKILLDQGCSSVVLSGAGPSLMGLFAGSEQEAEAALAAVRDLAPQGWEALLPGIDTGGLTYTVTP